MSSLSFHLARDLDTIRRLVGRIDTTRYSAGSDYIGHHVAAALDPCDTEAMEQSVRVDLAEAVILDVCDQWLPRQEGAHIPDGWAAALKPPILATQTRCLILTRNLNIVAAHPNVDQISMDIGRGADALHWAKDQGRL